MNNINTFFENITYMRSFRFYLAVAIVLTLVAWSNPANAESGTLSITSTTTILNNGAGGSSGTVLSFSNFTYDGSVYNYFTEFNHSNIQSATYLPGSEIESWTFTFSGDIDASSFTGSALWTKSNARLVFFFPDDTRFTKTTGYINLTNFVNSSGVSIADFNALWDSGASAKTCSAAPVALNGATNPITWRRVNSLVSCTPLGGSYWNVSMISRIRNDYSVTYQSPPVAGFTLTVNKKVANNIASTKINLTNGFTNYSGFPETSFNNNNISYIGSYNNGLLINMSTAAGLYSVAWINQTGSPFAPVILVPGTGGSPGGQVEYNYTNAIRGSTYGLNSTISAANFSTLNEYALYAYDSSGVLVPGYPIKFYTQNYSTLRMWTFSFSGSYHTNLTSCDVVCRASFGIIQPTVIDTATLDVTEPTGTYAISTDKTTYLPGENLIITVTRPAGVTVWVTALNNSGLTFPEIANNLAFANGINTQTVTLPSTLAYGNYSLIMFLSGDGTNQIASTQFGVNLAAGTLSIIWDGAFIGVGNYVNVKSSTALNTSTMMVTDPIGNIKSYTFPANSVNITSVYLNMAGTWTANITDNGNSSNVSSALLTAFLSESNETYTQCISKQIYVCWDKSVYTQGDPYTIVYKFPLGARSLGDSVFIFVFNPDSVEVLDYDANTTFDLISGSYTGTLQGTFSETATLGYYTAFIKTINAFGNKTWAVSRARLDPAATSVTTTEGQVSTTTSTNLLNVLGMVAFYGLMIYVGLLYGLIRLMTRTGAPIDGAGFIYAAVILANIVALIGLFDPFKMYVLVLTWVIAAATFTMSRRTVVGGE